MTWQKTPWGKVDVPDVIDPLGFEYGKKKFRCTACGTTWLAEEEPETCPFCMKKYTVIKVPG